VVLASVSSFEFDDRKRAEIDLPSSPGRLRSPKNIPIATMKAMAATI
jgi:hypothetical protein